ncbi:MAG: BMP family protein [Spirochaetaceae bacterium]|nr:BMP family protein [Spirochaetaceae bacterium]
MKKISFCVLIIALLAGVLFAGGGKAQPAKGAGDVTTRIVCDESGIDDKSFNQSAWEGVLRYYGETRENGPNRGKLYDAVVGQNKDQYEALLQQVTDEGYDLVIPTGTSFTEAVKIVGGRNPNQKYLYIDEGGFGLPNVLSAVFSEQEGSYLVGVVAALKAKADGIANPQFGFIGGMQGAVITRFEMGYVQGVLSVIPNAKILDYYAGSWSDPGSAKTKAKSWYDSGVYAIFSAAGSTGNGTIAQAKEYRAQGKNVWAIGVDSDQFADGLYNATDSAVLTSMIKRVDSATYYGLSQVKAGTFQGGDRILGMKEDAVGYTTTNAKAMPQSLINEVEAKKQDILSGKLVLAATYAEAKRLPGFPQDLSALDD